MCHCVCEAARAPGLLVCGQRDKLTTNWDRQKQLIVCPVHNFHDPTNLSWPLFCPCLCSFSRISSNLVPNSHLISDETRALSFHSCFNSRQSVSNWVGFIRESFANLGFCRSAFGTPAPHKNVVEYGRRTKAYRLNANSTLLVSVAWTSSIPVIIKHRVEEVEQVHRASNQNP